VISLDITGPHPKSRRGHVCILILVDHFTKWAEALPIRNHTAETVARVLLDHIFSRFDMPVRCLSDQRAEFESVLFTQLCQLMGINKLRTTPYKPSTNAVVERFHRTLNSMLAKVVSDNQRDWCEHLPSVMAAYRASAHESTQFSPNRLMFGHENRLPVDIVLGELAEPSPTVALNDFVASARDRQLQDFALVREHLGQAARRRKEQYDDRVNARAFQPGQLVWYYYPRRRQGLPRNGKNSIRDRIGLYD
jgi:transposase InsO family protein